VPYVAFMHQANRFLYPRDVDRAVGWGTNPEMQLLDAMHKTFSFIKRLDSSSVVNADGVLVNSEWIKAQIEECYDVKARICYPGVDVKQFKPSEKPRDSSYILSTNRHFPQKRLDWFIATVSGLAETSHNVTGVITGKETVYTETLKRIAEKMGVKGTHQLRWLYFVIRTHATLRRRVSLLISLPGGGLWTRTRRGWRMRVPIDRLGPRGTT